MNEKADASPDITFSWRNPGQVNRFRTGVCLHGHTMHSEECLSFLPRHLHQVPGISQILRRYEQDPDVNFARAWWTPPLSPASALRLERDQILGLDLDPLVSLTDHDKIDANLSLQVTSVHRATPVSVEWTVPYRRSIFHLGIHNLPLNHARRWMSHMAGFTVLPQEPLLRELLSACAKLPDVLIVLNHPFWLEEGVRECDHGPALEGFLHNHIDWIHAFELNGTRPWSENAATIELSRAQSRPIISGGDRHACEPSACLNLTNARTFSEFAAEIRDGRSSILFMPQYRRPLALRILEAGGDILRQYPEYPSRKRWIDRFFYRSVDGKVSSLADLWRNREPWVLRPATGLVQFSATTQIRQTLRFLLSRQSEVSL